MPGEHEPEPRAQRGHRLVAAGDELAAALVHRAVAEPVRPDAAADPVARLEHDDLRPGGPQGIRGGQPGEARTDDADHAHRR